MTLDTADRAHVSWKARLASPAATASCQHQPPPCWLWQLVHSRCLWLGPRH
jgi:hypothetical protein